MAAGGFSFNGNASGGGFIPGTATRPSSGIGGGGAATTARSNYDRDGPSPSPPPVRALAWDPTGTASLSLCPLPRGGTMGNRGGEDNGSRRDGDVDLDVFLSHDGTGCPEEETECLLRCLDAREEWMATRRSVLASPRRRGDGGAAASVTKLSMDYRAAMCECLMRLRGDDAENEDAEMKDDEDDEDEGGNNLELLSLTYAISHLAEIFLLLSSVPSSASAYPIDSGGGLRDENSTGRLGGPPGSLTADTVRYLRLHHSEGSFMDSPRVLEMLESDQPEYYQFPPVSSDDDAPAGAGIPGGPYQHPYWNVLLHLVAQGQLYDAWNLLSYHSACRRAEEEARAAEGDLSPEGQGFAALRAMLLSAPVPGGRGDGHCDDAGLDDHLEEEELEERGTRGGEDGDGGGGDPPEDIHRLLMDGVPPNAYLLWEPLPRRADELRNLRHRRDLLACGLEPDAEDGSSGSMPEEYQPRAAASALRAWQETVRVAAFPDGVGAGGGRGGVLAALFRRHPPLPQIVAVLLGAAPATDGGRTWSQALLTELLYARPEVTPEDIATRAHVAMSDGGGSKQPLQEIILSIMNGNAGQVVETMFSLCGGSSGAALPATMTSLLCNLLVDAGTISPHEDASSSPEVNIQTELLLLAAESVLSSFSVQEQSDVGVRTAVRLLLPHAPPRRARRGTAAVDAGSGEGDDGVAYEPRVAATIAEALSRRPPATDAEARDLLRLCEDAVRLGSVAIADACESLAFSRASWHRNGSDNNNLTREVYWLLRGMEVQSCWLPEDRRRRLGFACRRRFDSLCEGSANNLISMLSVAAITNFPTKAEKEKHEKEISFFLGAAEDVLKGVLQDVVMVPVLEGHVEANLLQRAVDIALMDARGDAARVAADIVHCLEERRLSEGDYGGVVSTLADPKMYSEFLRIAFALLGEEESSRFGQPMEFAECAFTVHGMHILMARLTQVLSWEGIICSSRGPSLAPSSEPPSSSKIDYFGAVRLAFSKGLMRALVSHGPSTATKTENKKRGGEMSLDEELELMLSPCI